MEVQPSAQQPPWKPRTRTLSATNANSGKPRNVDRELMRVKSLAVVSGLKAMSQEPQTSARPPSPTLSAAKASQRSSTSFGSNDGCRQRSLSQRSSSMESLHNDRQGSQQCPQGQRRHPADLDQLERELLSMFEELYLQKHGADDHACHCGASGTLPSGTLEQHLQQTAAMYLEQKEQESMKVRQLSSLFVKQDQLIRHLEFQLDQVTASHGLSQETCVDCKQQPEFAKAIQAMDELKDQLTFLQKEKKILEEKVQALNTELEASQVLLHATFRTTQTLAVVCDAQQAQLQTFELPRQPYQESDQDERARENKRPEARLSCGSIFSNHVPKVSDKTSEGTNHSSRRSSANTTYSNSRRHYTNRWMGGPLPPPAPPPTQPLPPIPTENIPPSREFKALPDPPPSDPEIIISDGEDNDNLSSRHSTASIILPDADTLAAYREFAEQLQARLSIPEEMNDLHVWQPDDLDIQQRFASQETHDKRESTLSKESVTFWKGMKKKLRV